MLQLTPLEETVARQELMQIGQVHLLADMISYKFSVPPAEVIELLTPLELKGLKGLGRYLLKAKSYKQIEAWVEGYLT